MISIHNSTESQGALAGISLLAKSFFFSNYVGSISSRFVRPSFFAHNTAGSALLYFRPTRDLPARMVKAGL